MVFKNFGRKEQSSSTSKNAKYRILIDLDKDSLKKLIDLGYVKKETKFSYLGDLSTQSQIGKVPELSDLFKTEDLLPNIFDEWWKKFLTLISEDLIKSFDFLQDSKLEIPAQLSISLNDYLEDGSNEVYLATGRASDGKPAFLIIVKSAIEKSKIKCEIPINTDKWTDTDIQEWPNVGDSNAKLWKASKS
jgi:hypothetical protein